MGNQAKKSVVKILSSDHEGIDEVEHETAVDVSHSVGVSDKFDLLINGVRCSLEFTSMSVTHSSHREDMENGGHSPQIDQDPDHEPDHFASCNFICHDGGINDVPVPMFSTGGASLRDFAEVLFSKETKANQKFLTDTVPLDILDAISLVELQKRIDRSSELSP